MSSYLNKKRAPKELDKKLIVEQCRRRCYYCGIVVWGSKAKVPGVFDHVKNYSYSGDNSKENYVLACDRCNLVKGDLSVRDKKHARTLVQNRLGIRYYPTTPGDKLFALHNWKSYTEQD